VLNFDSTMARLSARDFMREVLKDKLRVRVLLTGYDNHFGHLSSPDEGFADYVEYGREMGIEVVQASPLVMKSANLGLSDEEMNLTAEKLGLHDAVERGVAVSSSLVRRCLREGMVGLASQLLGRHYSVCGTVVSGEHVGRQLGFPTANILLSDERRLIPAPGVYAVMVRRMNGDAIKNHIAKDENETGVYGAMMNIGTRPTFGGKNQTLEVNLFDFTGSLYGEALSVEFVERLRSEQPFASAEALKEQLQRDAERASLVLSDLRQ